jgi:methyltransferase (TIGR00027 family)
LGTTLLPAHAVEPGKPSFTAEIVTAYRAIAALDPDKKIRNPDYMAEKFVSPEFWHYTPYSLDFVATKKFIDERHISTYFYVNARTKHIDSILKIAVAEGVKQVVNLGAGYDSRAYRFRNSMSEVRFFELDLPATVAQKKKRLAEIFGATPDWVAFVPIDFNTETLESSLKRAGYDPSQKTLFIWEGVTYYISGQAVNGTLRFVAQQSALGSSIVFDYMPSAVVQGDYGKYPGARRSAEFVARKGEPYTFGIREGEAEQYVKQSGLAAISDLGPDELVKKYLIRSDGSLDGQPSSWFRIMHATVPK